jgi:hypothetical protein
MEVVHRYNCVLYIHNQLSLSDIRKKAVCSAGEKRKDGHLKGAIQAASPKNNTNYFSFLWGKPISHFCAGDSLSDKKNSNLQPPPI